MNTMSLVINGRGSDGRVETRNQIDAFVRQNFDLLYEGAIRLGCEIPGDYYAPRRVQIEDTRLHEYQGLKYASGHKYSADYPPSPEQLRATIVALQRLLDAAAEDVPPPFRLEIVRLRS